MTFEEFQSTLKASSPPVMLNQLLVSLWYDKKGYWNRAHEIVQDIDSTESAKIHAYLHRKEGDLINAEYWYHRSGTSMKDISLEHEWESLVNEFINIG